MGGTLFSPQITTALAMCTCFEEPFGIEDGKERDAVTAPFQFESKGAGEVQVAQRTNREKPKMSHRSSRCLLVRDLFQWSQAAGKRECLESGGGDFANNLLCSGDFLGCRKNRRVVVRDVGFKIGQIGPKRYGERLGTSARLSCASISPLGTATPD